MLTAVGVPEISPVELSNDNPAGSAGVISQFVTAPPLDVGVTVVIALSLVRVSELGLYATEDGATSFTWMVTVAVSLPPALLAVTVYAVEFETAVGVPEIAPVVLSNARPAGRAGEIDQDVTVPPLEVGVMVVSATFLVSVSELGL